MGAKTLLSVAQFEQLPEIEGIFYEIDQGELVEVPSANFQHNQIRDELSALLRAHLKTHRDQGRAICAQDFLLGEDIVRQPDIALVGPEQVSRIEMDKGLQPFGPVLAAEIASPSNSLNELLRKKRQYFEAGARTVWIMVPASREVYVYTAGEHPRILSADDMLEETVLLPGFSVRVGDVFDI